MEDEKFKEIKFVWIAATIILFFMGMIFGWAIANQSYVTTTAEEFLNKHCEADFHIECVKNANKTIDIPYVISNGTIS